MMAIGVHFLDKSLLHKCVSGDFELQTWRVSIRVDDTEKQKNKQINK